MLKTVGQNRNIWSGLLLRALGLTVALFFGSRLLISELPQTRHFFASLGFWSLPLFAGIYALSVLLLIPHTLLTITGGALFGAFSGFVAVWIGALSGAVLAFTISRLLGRKSFESLLGPRLIKWTSLASNYGIQSILIARLIPIVPFTGFSYMAGLTEISLLKYAIGTGVGMAPATYAAVAVGAYGSEPGTWQFLLALTLLATASIIGVIFTKSRIKQTSNELHD